MELKNSTISTERGVKPSYSICLDTEEIEAIKTMNQEEAINYLQQRCAQEQASGNGIDFLPEGESAVIDISEVVCADGVLSGRSDRLYDILDGAFEVRRAQNAVAVLTAFRKSYPGIEISEGAK